MPVVSNRGKGEPLSVWCFPGILTSSAIEFLILHVFLLPCLHVLSVSYALLLPSAAVNILPTLQAPAELSHTRGRLSHLPCHYSFLSCFSLAHKPLWMSLPLDRKFPNNKTHVTFFSESLGSAQPLLQ